MKVLGALLLMVFCMAFLMPLTACEKKETYKKKPVEHGKKLCATAEFINAKGDVIGLAQLKQTKQGVKIHLELSGLTAGSHAMHIHETGKADAPDFKSAGGHFNPFGKCHGCDNPAGAHAGDLPNLDVGADGNVTADILAKDVTLKAGEVNSLFKDGGTAFVIHAGADDYKSDPAGNAGARVACAIIMPVEKK